MTLAAGTRLGPYEVLGPLGAGGMGEVYRARDERLSRSVALKVLPGEISADRSRLERFEKEARAASSLNHPNIVTIYDIGSSESLAYIAMELVEGRTLRELLVSGPIALRRLLSLSAQVADGLAKAHSAGIVHRDLKPENLMVTKDGFVKILDFGLAKLVPTGFEASEGSDLATVTRGTEPGTVLGTVGYMSPEQASGHPVDFRSDQFSLGAILYEMASGKRAFDRATAVQTLSAVIQDEPEPLSAAAPKTPANLIWIIERCLAKDPEERYGSTKDLARDLAALRDHASGISVSAVGQPAPRRFRPSRALFAGAVSAGVVLAALAFFAGQRSRRAASAKAAATDPDAHVSPRLPDGRAVCSRRPDDRLFRGLGREAERDLHDAGRQLRVAAARHLSGGDPGDFFGRRDGDLARLPEPLGALLRDARPGAARRRHSAGSSRQRGLGRLVSGRQGARRHPRGRGRETASNIRSERCCTRPRVILTALRVSPKGDLVAFLEHPRRDDARGTLCVVDRAGRKKNLTGEWQRMLSTLWSPTGDEVFFRRQPARERASKPGASISRAACARPPGFPVWTTCRATAWSWTSAWFDTLRRDIVALVPGASKESNLSWLGESQAADLSRDGRNLLFYEYQPRRVELHETFTTYLRKTDGSDAKMLGEGKALALSPDEKWALVVRPSPEPHLALLPTGVGEPRELPGGGATVQYHWASFFPDGSRILIAAQEKGKPPRSYIQDLSGGPPRPFAEEGMRATLVSPDGREIAGTTLEGLQLIYRADGEGRARAIPGAEPGDFLVQWSADGKSILVRGA